MSQKFRNLLVMSLLFSSVFTPSLSQAYISLSPSQPTTVVIGLDQCTQVDPNCIPKVTDLCFHNTTLSNQACYDRVLASQGCQTLGFADCVQKTRDYCYSNTTNDNSHCFDQAMIACKVTR